MQWEFLESYFKSNFDFGDDPIENDPDEKPSKEKRLVNAFKQPVSKLYIMFVQSEIPVFDSINTFLQLRNHWLIYCIILLYVCIAHHFQDLCYLKLSQNMQSINLEYSDVLKDFNVVFIVAMTKQYVSDSDIVGTSQYKKFLKKVRGFFIKYAKYLQTKINSSVKKWCFQVSDISSSAWKALSYVRKI